MPDDTSQPDLSAYATALLNPSVSPNYLNPAYSTPAQRAQLYKYADALMSPQPVKNGWQGLGEMVRSLVGGNAAYQANVQEQASQAQDKADLANTVGRIDSPDVSPGKYEASGPAPAVLKDAAAPPQSGSNSASPSANAPSAPDLAAVSSYIAQAAAKRGIDPSVATAMFNGESGLNPGATGDGNSSFGVAQLHYGNVSKDAPNSGLGDAFTKTAGLDARDPANWQKEVDFALDSAKTQGWKPWANTRDKLGIGNFTGIGGQPQPQAVQVAGPGAPPAPPIMSSSAPQGGGTPAAPPYGCSRQHAFANAGRRAAGHRATTALDGCHLRRGWWRWASAGLKRLARQRSGDRRIVRESQYLARTENAGDGLGGAAAIRGRLRQPLCWSSKPAGGTEPAAGILRRRQSAV
jgi:hypothetical protein